MPCYSYLEPLSYIQEHLENAMLQLPWTHLLLHQSHSPQEQGCCQNELHRLKKKQSTCAMKSEELEYKKRRNATKQGFQRFNQYWYDRNKKWNMAVKKMTQLFWLHWFHAASLVSIGQSKLKLLSRNLISIFSNSDLDLDHIHLGSNPKLCLDISYPYSKFGVNRPKLTYVIEWKLNFYF